MVFCVFEGVASRLRWKFRVQARSRKEIGDSPGLNLSRPILRLSLILMISPNQQKGVSLRNQNGIVALRFVPLMRSSEFLVFEVLLEDRPNNKGLLLVSSSFFQ